MKRHWMKALALLLALTLTVITIALAEENVATGDADDESIEVVEIDPEIVESTETEPVAEEVEEIALDDLMDGCRGNVHGHGMGRRSNLVVHRRG